MINHADIENIIGCKTLVTNRMQRAIEDWYDAAINGLPLDKNPETLTLDLPALICAELARLTTLELEATVEGSDRADWINAQLQRALTPRRRRIFTVALALGSGIWKPYQSGKKLGISFCNASRYFPVAHDVEGSLTEGVFIDSIQDDDNYYHRMEWMSRRWALPKPSTTLLTSPRNIKPISPLSPLAGAHFIGGTDT